MIFLTDLSVDVLLAIFASCTIRSVIRLSQCCKFFNDLAQDKTLWLSLTSTLRFHGILAASGAENQSVQQLKQLVERIVTGSTQSRRVPALQLQSPEGRRLVMPQLLGCGAYVVFLEVARDTWSLRCCRTSDGTALWARSPGTPAFVQTSFYGFAVEQRPGGVIAVACLDDAEEGLWLRVAEIDTTGTDTPQLVFSAALPASEDRCEVHLCGDLCALGCWLCSPEYILVLLPERGQTPPEMRLIAISELYAHFRSAGQAATVDLDTILPAAGKTVEHIPGPISDYSRRVISVHRNPLDLSVYRVWLYTIKYITHEHRFPVPSLQRFEVNPEEADPSRRIVAHCHYNSVGRLRDTLTTFSGHSIRRWTVHTADQNLAHRHVLAMTSPHTRATHVPKSVYEAAPAYASDGLFAVPLNSVQDELEGAVSALQEMAETPRLSVASDPYGAALFITHQADTALVYFE
ncbi:F-box domain-containing protein [Mycena kentingensis (nom. inval.)]|nr:F-box domain-containing protein [Mycena kentingensis (nom. inval.)]